MVCTFLWRCIFLYLNKLTCSSDAWSAILHGLKKYMHLYSSTLYAKLYIFLPVPTPPCLGLAGSPQRAIQDPPEMRRIAWYPEHARLVVPVPLRRHVKQLRDAGNSEEPHGHRHALAAAGDHRDVPPRDLLAVARRRWLAATLLPRRHGEYTP